MDFYSQVGKVAIGSRLRRLSESLTDDAAQIYKLYGVAADPRWFPVLYVLSTQEHATITEIAHFIGHSHPSVSQIVKKMVRQGIAIVEKDNQDARISVVKLSNSGKKLIPQLEEQCTDVAQAVESLLSEAQHDLWKAIEETEFLLSTKSFLTRVREVRKTREVGSIEIIDYRSEFHNDFKRLNYEWIEQYFEVEEADRQSLENPDRKILEPGGHILIALDQHEAVGTCALIKMEGKAYELAKMAVSEASRGKGIGFLLGRAAIDKARNSGAESLYLESNTKLVPAIKLYQKLGFEKVIKEPSPYTRCNIQMMLNLAQPQSY